MPGSGSGADVQHVTGGYDKVFLEGILLLTGALTIISCLTLSGSLNGIQYLQYLLTISGSGSPSFPLRVLLYAKVFHIRGTATGYKVKAWVNTFLLELRCIGVSLEVLYLCPDAKLWCLEAVPGLPVLGHSHPTEVIL